MVPVRIRPVPLTYASVRGGFLSLFPAAYGVRSPADAPALTSQGSDFLSLFLSPAEAGHMVGVAQLEERRSAKPCQPRVRIPPRPPGAHMPHRCQKWESPNLSSADSRQRPPAGIEPCPAVIWGSSLNGRASGSITRHCAGSNPACPTSPYGLLLIMPNADRAGRSAHHSPVRSIRNSTQVDKGTVLKTDRRRKSCVGSNPTCSANAKAMCGAWLGAYALPGRLDPANQNLTTLRVTPRKDGAAAGGIPLPAPRQNNALCA